MLPSLLYSGPAKLLDLPGTAGNYASTPDSATVSITGNIDIRVKVAMDDWTPAAASIFIGHGDSTPGWKFAVISTGVLRYTHYAVADWDSTAATGLADGALKWMRITRNVTTGDVIFYTSDDGSAWVQLGDTVATAASANPNSAAVFTIGANSAGGERMAGNVYYAELRNGIDGTVAARFDPNEIRPRVLSFTSSTGEVWTINQSGDNQAVLY